MERGGDISSGCGFNVLDKESLSNSDFVTWRTKLQFCTEGMMNNPGRPFVGGGGAGPTHSSGGAHEAQGGSIYRDGGQTTNIFPSRPQGEGMMMGFPFTAAQLKELQKQALIYKYMISSVPVPIHLLPQLSRTFPAVDSSIYSGRYSKNGDPEPGRCKRTDGKKWRCSKEVAPQQKYCDRHLHRGRPRSRKPVEAKDNHKKKPLESTAANQSLLLLNAKIISTSTSPYYNSHREGKVAASEQPWESVMKSNCYIPQQQQPLDAFCYPNLNEGDSMGDNGKSRDWVWVSPGPLGGSRPASPSGVLHWTLLSQSDSSVCSSPTFVAPPSQGYHN